MARLAPTVAGMLLEAIRSADRRDWARARDYLRASLELEPISDISRALKRVEIAAHHPDSASVKVDLRLYLGQVLELPDLPFLDAAADDLGESGTDIDALFPPSDAAAFVVSNPFPAAGASQGRDSVTLVPGSMHVDDILSTLTPTLPPGGGASQLAQQLASLSDSEQHQALSPTVPPTGSGVPGQLSVADAAFADLAADLMKDPFGFDDLVPFPPPAEMPTLPVQPPTPDLLAAIAALHPDDREVRVRDREELPTPVQGLAPAAPFGDATADTLPPMDFGAPLRFDNEATLPPTPPPAIGVSGPDTGARQAETPVHAVPVVGRVEAFAEAPSPWAAMADAVPTLPSVVAEPPGPSDAELISAAPVLFAAPSELRAAALAPKEMYFVSLMDGATVVEDLLDMSNMPRAEVFSLLRRLLRDRIIRLDRA